MMSGIVETMLSGIVPDEPIKAGETFPARGSRVRHVRTSAYICPCVGQIEDQ